MFAEFYWSGRGGHALQTAPGYRSVAANFSQLKARDGFGPLWRYIKYAQLRVGREAHEDGGQPELRTEAHHRQHPGAGPEGRRGHGEGPYTRKCWERR